MLSMWKWMGLFLSKNCVLRWSGWLFLLDWIGALTLFLLLKLLLRKLEPWFALWSFFLLKLLCISITTIQPFMEYCCHVWAGTPCFCLLELLDKQQKSICITVGSSLATSLEPLAHCQNVSNLSLFYRYYFRRCPSELTQMVPLHYSPGRSTRYSGRLHEFSVSIPICYKDFYVNSFFPCVARLWNSLPIEWFYLIYDLNGFKSRIYRHLLVVVFFLNRCPAWFNIFVLFFSCNSMPRSGCSALHGVNPS